MNTPIQPSMFTNLPASVVVTSSHPREAEIQRAMERASELVLERYEAVLRSLGSVLVDFIAGDVTERYEAKYGPLAAHDKKALGGLFQRLMRSGVIEKTGEYRARNQGNAAAVYRLKVRI